MSDIAIQAMDPASEAALYKALGYVEIDRYNDDPHAELWFEKYI